jgi:hypothetical protein
MRNITLALCLAMLAVPAAATRIALYDAPSGGSCSIATEVYPQYAALYVVLEPSDLGSTRASFRVDISHLHSLITNLGWTSVDGNCVAGCDPLEGVIVGPRPCSTDGWVLFRGDFILQTGRIAGCTQLDVVSFPGADVLVYDCADNPHSASTGSFYFGDRPGDCPDCSGGPVPVQMSTWGQIKALYR